MFATLAKLAALRVVDPWRVRPEPPRHIYSGNNRPSARSAAVRRQSRRQVLVCQWHSMPADGRLECRWRIEPGDGTPGEDPGESSTRSQLRLLLNMGSGEALAPSAAP
jgi:hypothetical protein